MIDHLKVYELIFVGNCLVFIIKCEMINLHFIMPPPQTRVPSCLAHDGANKN